MKPVQRLLLLQLKSWPCLSQSNFSKWVKRSTPIEISLEALFLQNPQFFDGSMSHINY